jgi:tetratricopeptide (TPR) repeat protein
MRAWNPTLTLVIGASCLLAPQAPRAEAADRLSPKYLDLLLRYAHGERPAAIAALGEWSEGAVQKQLGILENASAEAERCPKCPNPLVGVPLRAAVMLHADRDKVEKPEPDGREQIPSCPGAHARVARRYAAILARNPATQDFARRFFLTMALLWQHRACFEDAVIEANAGLERFPRDAELLLTAGCTLEERAFLSVPRVTGDESGALPQEWLKEARRDLTDAVAANPDLVLARIRLGRVLWRLGQQEAAREALEAAVARARTPNDRYLAHLYLGRIHEDAQRLDQALAQYRRAVEVFPEGQSAAVALSYALQLAGEAEASREALARGVIDGGKAGDAYSDYLAGNTEGADRMEAALHRESLE